MVTRWEVEDAIEASDIEPTGRHIVLSLLKHSVASTAEIPPKYAPTFTDLERKTGYSRSTLAEWMKALTAAGWVRREDFPGESRPGFALAVGASDAAPPKRVRKAVGRSSVSPAGTPTGRTGDSNSQMNADAAFRQPALGDADAVPAAGTERSGSRNGAVSAAGTQASAPIRNLPTGDAVPPSSPSSPSPGGAEVNDEPASVEGWRTSDRKTTPAVVAQNSPRPARPQPLFPKAALGLPEAVRIVLDSLQSSHGAVTADDAREVHKAVIARYPSKCNINYLRAMAGNGSFAPFLDEILQRRAAERAEQIDKQIRALQETEPECEHEWSAGRAPHPTTGLPLCPWCRTGETPPPPKQRDETHPELAEVLAAYRSHAGARPLSAPELIELASDASALRRAGVPTAQIIATARRAGRAQTSLIAAAKIRKDQPA